MTRADDLLDDALDSFGAAKDLLATKRWAKICFLCQQATELAVKAALNALGRERRGHDITTLLQELGELRADVLELEEDARILDQYYIPTRYMNAFSDGSARSHFTEKQSRDAIDLTNEVLIRMKAIIRDQRR